MALLTRPPFQETGEGAGFPPQGAKWSRLAPFNRLATATAPSSPIGQPLPATPVLDGIPGRRNRYLNRYPNRFNRPANRVKG